MSNREDWKRELWTSIWMPVTTCTVFIMIALTFLFLAPPFIRVVQWWFHYWGI